MKYSVEQMQQSLKDGKVIWFYHESSGDILYKGYLEDDRIQVEWEGSKISYPFNSEYTPLEYWVCTKIDGEGTVTNKPHKHADLIKKWADGAIIQSRGTIFGSWVNCDQNRPSWDEQVEYRVKPTIVKKWNWVCKDAYGGVYVTYERYSEKEIIDIIGNRVIQKIDSTMIEVEE